MNNITFTRVAKGQKFYYISDTFRVHEYIEREIGFSDAAYAAGNYFTTREQAVAKLKSRYLTGKRG